MGKLRVGNAPCSWGTLEFEETQGAQVNYGQMLDELAATGYTGTELGDWGYMPSDPATLRNELKRRDLVMLGAFVQLKLKDPAAHEAGTKRAVETARLLAAVATDPKPFLVLSDDNATDPTRTANTGRVTADMGLTPAEWNTFAAGAMQVADSVFAASGLRTVFHHHSAGYVETPDEIARFLDLTDPQRIGLVFDTGHYCFGAGKSAAVEGLQRFKDRVWYIHLKDCEPRVADQVRGESLDYFEALRRGVFCELGRGCVDFPGVLRWLKDNQYDGYVLVEQDILPGMGTPKASALRNREYLRSIESNY